MKRLIICVLILLSCSLSAQKTNKYTIYICPADSVQRYNNKYIDSVVYVLDSVDYMALREVYLTELEAELKHLGFNVKQGRKEPNELKNKELLLDIHTLELEEGTTLDSITNVYDFADDSQGEIKGMVFYKRVNSLDFAAVISLQSHKNQILDHLYLSDSINDDLDGYIEKNNPETPDENFVEYYQTIINENDAYIIAFLNGTKTARIIFDNYLQ